MSDAQPSDAQPSDAQPSDSRSLARGTHPPAIVSISSATNAATATGVSTR